MPSSRWNSASPGRDGVLRRIDGTSAASTVDELGRDFAELWLKLFAVQLPLCPTNKWTTILGAVQVCHGTVALIPCVGKDLRTQVAGCGLYLSAFHSQWNRTPDAELPSAGKRLVETISAQLLNSFHQIQHEPSVRTILHERPVPFFVLTEPTEPPVIEITLR